MFSSRFACPVSGFTIEEIEPRLFSFNSPHGACPECDGLGVETFFDPHLVVPDERAGAGRRRHRALERRADALLRPDAAEHRPPLQGQHPHALGELPERVRNAVLHGSGDEPIEFSYKDGVRAYSVTKPFEGVLHNLQRR